jgi:hypothetical protein
LFRNCFRTSVRDCANFRPSPPQVYEQAAFEENKMKAFIINALSALTLAGALNAAGISVATAQTGACFRGDTMDRDAGHTGALGAPKCTAKFEGHSDAYALFEGGDATAPSASQQTPYRSGDATLDGIGH